MMILDPATVADAKREFLGKLDAAATAGNTSASYVYLWRARDFLYAVAVLLFGDYPREVHAQLNVLCDTGVPDADWVDRHDNGEALERVQLAVRQTMERADRDFERVFAEHLDLLNSVPREYMLAAAGVGQSWTRRPTMSRA